MKRFAVVALIVICSLVLPFSMAFAKEKTFKLKLTSAFPTKLPIVEEINWLVKEIKLLSGGAIQIKLYEPGALVPPFEIQDAVSSGQVQMGFSCTVYLSGKIPAAALFTSVPFGPDVTEYYSWFVFGNGAKYLQQMYDDNGFNVKVWPAAFLLSETGGWFNKEINKVEDFKGLTLRFPGLGGKVLSKVGASVTMIPGGEIFPSLEKGAIDGTEFSNPVIDSALGFYKVAKFNYFPGWHQPSTANEITMNKDIWNRMSERQKAVIDTAITAYNLRCLVVSQAKVGQIIKNNVEKHGVKNRLYTQETLRALKKAWEETAKEESDKNAFFKKVYDDLNAFMKSYQAYECLGYSAMPNGCK